MLHVIWEYFLAPSHFIVILPIESIHIYKIKIRRSVSTPTKVTCFPSQAMTRTEDTISTSTSPTLYLTVSPLEFRLFSNKSIKHCLFLVLDRKTFWDVEVNSLSIVTHTSAEIATFINLRRPWFLVDGRSRSRLKTATHFPYLHWLTCFWMISLYAENLSHIILWSR